MTEQLLDMWRIAPAAILLLMVLWAGHKGWWYWDAGVRRLVLQLERERDVWRSLALTLLKIILKKEGIDLPEALFEVQAELQARKPEADRWRNAPPS